MRPEYSRSPPASTETRECLRPMPGRAAVLTAPARSTVPQTTFGQAAHATGRRSGDRERSFANIRAPSPQPRNRPAWRPAARADSPPPAEPQAALSHRAMQRCALIQLVTVGTPGIANERLEAAGFVLGPAEKRISAGT